MTPKELHQRIPRVYSGCSHNKLEKPKTFKALAMGAVLAVSAIFGKFVFTVLAFDSRW